MIGLGKLFPKEPIEVSIYDADEATIFGWTAAVSDPRPIFDALATAAEDALTNTVAHAIWNTDALQYGVRVERIDFATKIDLRILLWKHPDYPPDRRAQDCSLIHATCHDLAVRLYAAMRDKARTKVRKPDLLHAELELELRGLLAAAMPGTLEETAARLRAVVEEREQRNEKG